MIFLKLLPNLNNIFVPKNVPTCNFMIFPGITKRNIRGIVPARNEVTRQGAAKTFAGEIPRRGGIRLRRRRPRVAPLTGQGTVQPTLWSLPICERWRRSICATN